MEAPCSSGHTTEQLFVADWIPVPLIDQSMKYSVSNGLSSFNAGSSNTHVTERLPTLSSFGNESLSEIMSSFGLPEHTKMASSLRPQDFPSTNEQIAEENHKGKKRKMPDCGALISNTPPFSNQLDESNEADQQKDGSPETVKSSTKKNEKNQKNDGISGVKENGNAIIEDYVHKRARRGQATNSHSLAERVRREKISERMKLLQDIVPGCNKITGKAVMLDEIINYVQSLQRQVEFLSMKLSTVNPELSLNIEQILAKDDLNLHSRYGGSSAAIGYCSEMVSSHPQFQAGMPIPSLQRDLLRATTNPHISALAQMANPWDDEFQNVLQMGFVTKLPHDGMDLNGSMKVEL